MHRTGATYLIPGGLAGDEAEEAEDFRDGHSGPDFRITNAWHGSALQGRVTRYRGPRGDAPEVRVAGREEEPVRDRRRSEYGAVTHPLSDRPRHHDFPCAPTTSGSSPAPPPVRPAWTSVRAITWRHSRMRRCRVRSCPAGNRPG